MGAPLRVPGLSWADDAELKRAEGVAIPATLAHSMFFLISFYFSLRIGCLRFFCSDPCVYEIILIFCLFQLLQDNISYL